jgi:hypothetical protein
MSQKRNEELKTNDNEQQTKKKQTKKLDAEYLSVRYISIADIHHGAGLLRKALDPTVKRMGKSKNNDPEH